MAAHTGVSMMDYYDKLYETRQQALEQMDALDGRERDDYLDRSARSYAKCPGLHTDADQKYIPFRDDEDAPMALRDMEEW